MSWSEVLRVIAAPQIDASSSIVVSRRPHIHQIGYSQVVGRGSDSVR